MKSILLLGPPGSGKVKLARSMALDLGNLGQASPFRAPHHTVSTPGLLGIADPIHDDEHGRSRFGPMRVYPGEATLANDGCLFLDELTEFRRSAVERLGDVLRAGLHRVSTDIQIRTAPALLVASSNVCPCGAVGTLRPCHCTVGQLERWNERLVEYCDLLGIQEIQEMPFRTMLDYLHGTGPTP
jgi:magnesium chelatase family protein